MIQDIAPHSYDVTYRTDPPQADDYLLFYAIGGLYGKRQEEEVTFLTISEAQEMIPGAKDEAKYLFSIDERRYYELRDIPSHIKEEEGGSLSLIKIEELRLIRPLWKSFAAITGYQIHKWYSENRFCGVCGGRMKAYGKERAMKCPQCGHLAYPKISPCVIVAVTDQDRILFTRYNRGHSAYQRYGLIAGFAEVGECLEDVVRREVAEEVGLTVKNIRYYKSQPWSFTDTLLVGFYCELDGDDQVTLEQEELSEATWFHRKELPKERSDGSISLTGELMDAFARGEF